MIKIPAYYYQQFDADDALETPALNYGGWRKTEIDLNLQHTALIVMHAWDFGTKGKYPGWHRAVEYIPRAQKICDEVFPELLDIVRNAGMDIFHIALPGPYLNAYKGYKSRMISGEEDKKTDGIFIDDTLKKLRDFKSRFAFPGEHNMTDIQKGFDRLDFPFPARPIGDEPIAVTSEELFELCQSNKINHLIYTGFAINGCVLTSPGGMVDMTRKGIMCSAIKQAVTAIENRESAKNESAKELALWFVSIISGFVFELDDFTERIKNSTGHRR